jgi:hypothetical protein
LNEILQVQLNEHTLSFHDDVVLKNLVQGVVEKEFSPGLTGLSEVVGTSQLLQLPLHHDDKLLNCFSLIEDVSAGAFIFDLISLKKHLLVLLEQIKK